MSLAVTSLKDVLFNLELPLPCGRTLRAHQREAIYRIWGRGSGILAHKMSLGKTLTALVAAAGWGVRVMCIVKPGLVENWRREADAIGLQADIMSWTQMPVAPGPWKPYVLITDESHMFRSIRSHRTLRMLELAREAEAVIHCTGTPMPNGQPRNLYPLLLSIRHPIAQDKRDFEMRYCQGRQQKILKKKYPNGKPIPEDKQKPIRFWDNAGASNLKELWELTKDAIDVKQKRDCLDLPAFEREFREVALSEDMRWLYDQSFNKARERYLARLAAGEIKEGAEHLVEMQMVAAAASIAKSEYAVELSRDILSERSKVVVFTCFQESAEIIADSLGCDCMTGATPADKRQKMVDKMAEKRSCALVATMGTGSEGLNGMQEANYCILVDRGWEPASWEQAESRIDRQGQERNMTSIWLTLGEFDRRKDEMLIRKQDRIDLALQGERQTMRGLSAKAVQRQLARTLFER